THSQGQPRSPGMKKKRSRRRATSFSGGGWGIPATFDENNLSRRPEDWRYGYSPRGISGADIAFSSLFRVGKKVDLNGTPFFFLSFFFFLVTTCVLLTALPSPTYVLTAGWPDDTKQRTLAPVLTHNASRPNISYAGRHAVHGELPAAEPARDVAACGYAAYR
ncbi:hypothetical protein B0H12DRAFT_1109620, partial [Mycena haematopus]